MILQNEVTRGASNFRKWKCNHLWTLYNLLLRPSQGPASIYQLSVRDLEGIWQDWFWKFTHKFPTMWKLKTNWLYILLREYCETLKIAYGLHFHLNNWKKLHQFSELHCQIENAPVMLDFSSSSFFLFFFGGGDDFYLFSFLGDTIVMVWQELAFDERLINCNWQFKTKWTIEQQIAI